MSDYPVPRGIHRADDGLTVTWDEGHVGFYPARMLRLACHCATCREEMTGRTLLDPTTVPEDIAPQTVSLVGGYAIKIQWSDGHDTGIYAFEYLHRLCPCASCTAERAAGEPPWTR